jgi:hypothetical protein
MQCTLKKCIANASQISWVRFCQSKTTTKRTYAYGTTFLGVFASWILKASKAEAAGLTKKLEFGKVRCNNKQYWLTFGIRIDEGKV